MFQKKIRPPLNLLMHEALKRRLPPQHPIKDAVKKNHAAFLAGYKGEKSLEYFLHKHPHTDPLIFHDLRLPAGDHFFQMDFLILTPEYALIIEVKNYVGHVYFDFPVFQMIRTFQGVEEGFQDPVVQLQNHRYFLEDYLPEHFPIETLAVMTQKQTVIKYAKDYPFADQLIHASYLPQKLHHYHLKHTKKHLSLKEWHKLADHLLNNHTIQKPDIFSKYKVNTAELQTGVLCSSCKKSVMRRCYANWICLDCNSKSRHTHLQSLLDYSLLYSPSITNQSFRWFVHLSSPSVAGKLLQKLNLKTKGSNRNRHYSLTDQEGYPLFIQKELSD
ncbi:NERD domain-containing protein [Halobacillus fulvus]|nr:NERD domain-containing protein [Halobacillus fulvus]